MPRTWRESLVILTSASIALAPGLALAPSQSGPDQVMDGAKQVGEGAAESAKNVGKTVTDAGKRAGQGAEEVGDRLHQGAKGFGEALLGGIKYVGRTVVGFFTGDKPRE